MTAGVKITQLDAGHALKSHESSSSTEEEDAVSLQGSMTSHRHDSLDSDEVSNFNMSHNESCSDLQSDDADNQTVSLYTSQSSLNSCPKPGTSSKRGMVSMEIFESDDNRQCYIHSDYSLSSEGEQESSFKRYFTSSRIYINRGCHIESEPEIDLESDCHYDGWHGDPTTSSLDYIINDQNHIPRTGL